MEELLEKDLLQVNSNEFSKYNHQSDAIDRTLDYFSDISNTRGKIIMPCGSGKSLTSFWVLEQMNLLKSVNRTIITVPNLILQGQIFKTFYSGLYETHKFICIGSDKDIKGDYTNDEVTVTTYDKEIKSFIKSNKNNQVVIIATYQSLNTLSEICKENKYDFDLAIIDEAHRTVGSKEKCFSTVLFDRYIKIKRRLFMTATEKIYVGKDDTIIGMENPEYYGKTIFEYKLPQAIKDGILSDYRIATIYSTNEEIIEFINSNKYLNSTELGLSNKEYKNIMSSLLATIRAIREKGCRKIVTYHNTIKKAQIFKDLLDKVISNNLLNIGTFHINGNQSAKDKNLNMLGFENSFVGVLTNSQALVEGIDIPCIDCIVFADKRESAIGIIQAVGRALRRFKGKTESYVVVPILTETEDDVDIENSEFYGLFNIIMSLGLTDARIVHELRGINEINSNKTEGSTYNKIIENIIGVDNRFKDKITSLISKINLKVWNKIESQPFLEHNYCIEWIRKDELTKNIKSEKGWKKITRLLPSFIPKKPKEYYNRQGTWVSWGYFLGTSNINYYDCIDWIRKDELTKNIKTTKDWYKITKLLPSFIPKNPDAYYKKQGTWISWGDCLGTRNFYKGNFLEHNGCIDWIRKDELTKNIKTKKEWNKIKHLLPSFIPKDPTDFYKKQGTWIGWGYFLGTGNKSKGNYVEYNNCVNWIRKDELTKNIKSYNEWKKISKKLPSFIPKNPDAYYKKQGTWISWGDFLGTSNNYYAYEELKKYIKENELTKNIKSSTEWYKITHLLPSFIPKNPYGYYKKQGTWISWGDFLGTGNKKGWKRKK